MKSPTRRKRVGVLSIFAMLASTVAYTLLPGATAGAAPVTGPVESVLNACNNTFQPAKFNLEYLVTPTIDVTAPLEPGDTFTAQFDVSQKLAASFLNGAYVGLGGVAVPLPISEGSATIAPLENATGDPLVITAAPVTVPAQTPNGLPWNAVSNPVVDDVVIPLGASLTGTFTVPAAASLVLDPVSGNPEPATFQFLGNAFQPAVVGPPAQPADPLPPGVTETGWTGAGLGAALTTTGSQTYAKALIGGALPAFLVCMAGQWTAIPGSAGPPVVPDSFGFPLIAPTGFSEVEITLPPVPTVNISAIAGQLPGVTNAARATNVITFGGPNWATGTVSSGSIQLCDSGGLNCSATQLTSASASITTGTLAGTATVDASATTGSRTLKVTSSTGESDVISLTILGTPTLTLSSGSGPAGGTINVSGTNWNPGPATVAVPIDGVNPIAAPTPVTVGATGGMNGTLQTPAGTAAILVVNGALPAPPAPGALFALQPFTINTNALDCGQGAPLTGCALQQTVTLNIEPGSFSWSQLTPFVVLNSTTTGNGCVEANQLTCFGLKLNGQNQVATGSLNQVTIIDARGQNAPWSVSALMTDLVTGAGGPNKVIAANRMTLTPACAVTNGGPPLGTAAVQTGPAATLSPTTPIPVCSANANQGGGTFTLNGGLSLQVPASQAAGLYQSTITLTAV